jgi:hypothetical protein
MNPGSSSRVVGIGFVVGVVVLFVFCLVIAAALDVSGWAATAASFFVGLFAGGPLGSMVAFRLTATR